MLLYFLKYSYFHQRVAGKIWIHFSQFSETRALCCKNTSIMPALCLMLQILYHARKYAGIIRQTLHSGQVRCTNFFIGFFSSPAWGGGAVSTVAILILTLTTIWFPGTCFKQIFFLAPHSRFALLSKLYSRGNIKYQTHLSAIAWLMRLHCIFVWCWGKYQFYIFIPFEPEAVNQGFR